MRSRVRQITEIIAVGTILAYLGVAAVSPMDNYAIVPASLVAVILASGFCGALLALITDRAVQSMALASLLALFLFGGIRAYVIAWTLTSKQIPFGLAELAISDAVFQYVMQRGLFMFVASGLVGAFCAAVMIVVLPMHYDPNGRREG